MLSSLGQQRLLGLLLQRWGSCSATATSSSLHAAGAAWLAAPAPSTSAAAAAAASAPWHHHQHRLLAAATSPASSPGPTSSSSRSSPTTAASTSTSSHGQQQQQPHHRHAHPAPLHHATVSPFPPTHHAPGPLTVAYPFPVQYHADREVLVRSLAGAASGAASGAAPCGVAALPGAVFNAPVRLDLLHRVVRWLRAAWQQGTHKAKRRGEVRGGGRKPWPQKGTGRARHGSIRAPQWRKGGAALGPRPRSHAHALPLAIQLQGYKCALSAKAHEGRLVVVDSLQPAPVLTGAPASSSSSASSASASSSSSGGARGVVKTKATAQQLRALLAGVPHRTALLVDCGPGAGDGGAALRRGAGNLPWVAILPWYELTVYDVLRHGALVITRPAAAQLAARLLQPPLPARATAAARRQRQLGWWRAQQAALAEAAGALQRAEATQLPVHQPRRRRWLQQ